MVVTIHYEPVKLILPTWQHHRPMIASTIVPIIQWQMTMHSSHSSPHRWLTNGRHAPRP
jgi:hypothetical protein